MSLGPAFGGEFVDSRNPVGDRRIAAPEHTERPVVGGVGPPTSAAVLRISPVRVTLASAGNRQRQGIVGVLRAFSHGGGRRTTMAAAGYPFFRMSREERFDRVPTNRLARPRRLYKVIPNRQGIYRAPQYGEGGQVVETTGV